MGMYIGYSYRYSYLHGLRWCVAAVGLYVVEVQTVELDLPVQPRAECVECIQQVSGHCVGSGICILGVQFRLQLIEYRCGTGIGIVGHAQRVQ